MEKINVKKLAKIAKKDSEASLFLARLNFEGKGGLPQDDKKGIKFAQQAVKQGNKYANNFLGFAYANGYGVSRNVKKAAKFYTKAKEFEDGIAEYSLYVLAHSGELGKKEQKNASGYLKEAADKGNCYIKYNEAVALNLEYKEAIADPDITKEDLDVAKFKKETSFNKLLEAHDAGCEDATLALAIIYLTGDGVEKDYDKAVSYLNMLDETKCPLINYIYGYMFDAGIYYAQNYWKAYEYYKKVYDYYKDKELKQDGESATIAIALCKLTGLGCDMNEKSAYNMFLDLAKETNNAFAYYYAGICLAEGRGCEKKPEEAFKYFEKASKAGIKEATYRMGKACDKNEGGKNLPDKCIKYYQEAADAGVPQAKVGLAMCYKEGMGVTQDVNKAYQLISDAAHEGNADALYEYANFYVNGEIVDQDLEEAERFMAEAAKRGSLKAVNFLEKKYSQGNAAVINNNGKKKKKVNKKEAEVGKDPVKAFEVKIIRALNGAESLYIKLAEAYLKGVKDVVEKDGEMAAYWYAKTVLQSKSKKERANAAKKLKLFAKDLDGNWNFKKISKKNDAAIIKQRKKDGTYSKKNKNAVVEEEIKLAPVEKASVEEEVVEETPVEVETPVTEFDKDIKPLSFDEMMKEEKEEVVEEALPVEELKDDALSEAIPMAEEVEEAVPVAEAVPVEEDIPVAEAVDEVAEALPIDENVEESKEEAPVEEVKELSKKEKKAAEKQAKLDAKLAKKNK